MVLGKLISVGGAILIATIQVIIRNDFFNFLNLMSFENSLIYVLTLFGLIITLSGYFSNWKLRYVIFTSVLAILIGHTIVLFPLFLSEKIFEISILNNEQNLLILTLAKFGALPSLAITLGIMPKRKYRLKESFSWRRKSKD